MTKSRPDSAPQESSHRRTRRQTGLIRAVAACAAADGFVFAIRETLAAAQNAIDSLGASCRRCGQCCLFERAGHRLYVSTGELALLIERPPFRRARAMLCPYQDGPLCAAGEHRPLGCRCFFCSTTTSAGVELRGIYERFHGIIRLLHREHNAPYSYVELTSAMEELAGTGDV